MILTRASAVIEGIEGDNYGLDMLVRLERAGRTCYKSESREDIDLYESAKKFVGPITFAALSGNPVIDDNTEWSANGDIEHILLSKADLLVVAPATANTIAKMSHGIADNVLTSLYLAFEKNVLVFPAMNVNMLNHVATKRNLANLFNPIPLDGYGVRVIEPAEGRLACGDVGRGKLPGTRVIIDEIEKCLDLETSKEIKTQIKSINEMRRK